MFYDLEDPNKFIKDSALALNKNGIFIAPLKAGTYDIVCGKPSHIERGMKGTLIVK